MAGSRGVLGRSIQVFIQYLARATPANPDCDRLVQKWLLTTDLSLLSARASKRRRSRRCRRIYGAKSRRSRDRRSNYPDIDGFLVGGASLKPEICEIVKEIAVAKNTFAMGGA